MHFSRPQSGAYATTAASQAMAAPKDAEARVFTQVTRRLIALHADPDADIAARVEVLNDNLSLWNAVAVAVFDDSNAMPEALRAGLANLAGFVDRQTKAVLRGGGDIRLLVDVNRRVIGGLAAAPAVPESTPTEAA
ncbi:flagellar biosynthesis regulator FlaF [Jannaschia sp. LMIT008]|uniref:flagellar biosynthesis regulator FlaF n=1 Tax=Jannaschia maritima TaxID=3032585 RepID=UPI0028117D34|nr:flagellar biosynthesis regulator FlaF [Jannaschia sp. LMIT008]